MYNARAQKYFHFKNSGGLSLITTETELSFSDHLWKQHENGRAELKDMNELLYKADVCIIEISHEVDHRLLEFTKLQKQWFKKLESYLDEESKKENLQATIQVNNLTQTSPQYHPNLI